MALLTAAPASAQGQEEDQTQDEAAAAPGATEEETKQLPPLGLELQNFIGRAQTCLQPEEGEEVDLECANEAIERAGRIRNLNNHEMAQLLNLTAYVAFQEEDTPRAIDAYEKIKMLPVDEMPEGLVSAAWRNLASLYVEQEDYQRGLAGYRDWMALPFIEPTLTALDYFFLSQLYYLVDDLPNGLDSVNKAIEIAQSEGSLGEENWWSMRYFYQYQLEMRDEALDTLIVLAENWTKRDWIMQLAGQMTERERIHEALTLYEAAYEMGWMETSSQYVSLAQYYMNNDMAFKGARVLQAGLEDGKIESTQQNWRMLATAWQMTRDDFAAIPALMQASELAEDGEIDRMLATSLARLGRWEECVDAAQSALDRGDLDRPDLVYLQLGRCYIALREYEPARTAFNEAAKDDRQNDASKQWLKFIDDEEERARRNAETLALVGR